MAYLAVQNGRRSSQDRWTQAVVFWGMVFLAFATLTPCVLLPEWQAYRLWKKAEQQQVLRVVRLEERVEQEQRRLEAIRTDPGVIRRVALRELGLHGNGEFSVQTGSPSFQFTSDVLAQRSSPPAPLPQAATDSLPGDQIVAAFPPWSLSLFVDPQSRRLLMALSLGLLGVAFVLFGLPRRLCYD